MSETTSPKTCTKCHGKGSIEGFGYIDGGRCWACLGAGTLTAQKAAKPFITIKSVRIERKNSLGGPIDITLAERDGDFRVAITDEKDLPSGPMVRHFDTIEAAKAFANGQHSLRKGLANPCKPGHINKV